LANRKHPVSDKGPVIIAPDAGARARAQQLARMLDIRDVVIMHKGRPRPNVARVAALSAADRQRVAGCYAVLVDDMIDTAGTITAAAQRLREAGATHITIIATHAVLSGPALTRLRAVHVDRIIVSDSLALPPGAHTLPVHVVTVASVLVGALRAMHKG
jgi:ribose-phosphate pyrophosphokinase